jgi:hypothetical protein
MQNNPEKKTAPVKKESVKMAANKVRNNRIDPPTIENLA